MKNKLHGALLTTAVFTIGTSLVSFAQKTNETSAAIEYKKGFASMMEGDMANAGIAFNKAKGYIDLAAVHPDTKESPKTLYYKGEIYVSILATKTNDAAFTEDSVNKYMNEGLAATKKAYTSSDKFDGEIEQSINFKKGMFGEPINKMYDEGKFLDAAEGYDMQVKLADALNIIDTANMFNAGVCYERAEKFELAADRYQTCASYKYKAPDTYLKSAAMLKKLGKKEEAMAMIEKAKAQYPTDRDVLMQIVNGYLDEGKTVEAEKALQQVIAADPNNKLLHYIIGTIYFDLKQYDKAEAALNKALEIDPNYADAQYQLGAFLNELATTTTQEASRLPIGDTNYDAMIAKSQEYYRRSITPLEKYIATSPNDKQVLLVLAQNYRAIKNVEKAAEYKKRADAIK